MTVNKLSKNNLAKLLATENLIVEHRNVSTAAFDILNRRLILPTWENISSDTYDLLVGHEVGHALFTPQQDLNDVCESISKEHSTVIKSYLNVIEDARIEKKIKRKFNGLRKNFRIGYQELVDQDFFGLSDKKVSECSFIDRINLYFKIGNLIDVPFTADEKVLVEKIEDAETFEQVVKLTRDVYEASGGDRNDFQLPDDMEYASEGDGDPIDGQVKGDSEQGQKTDQDSDDDNKSSHTDKNSDKDGDTKSNKTGRKGANGGTPEKSETQENFEENSEDLVDKDRKEIEYLNIPNLDNKGYVVNYKDVYISSDSNTSWSVEDWVQNIETLFEMDEIETNHKELYKTFRKDSTKTVNYLVKEFELKKNAEQLSRAKVSKTGRIDVNKLHSYRYTEDIFSSITEIPGGKNHGLILFLDWSGSFSNSIFETIKQLLNLTLFCKKVGIPFEVYSFNDLTLSDNIDRKYRDYQDGDLLISDFELRNLLSSKMNNREYEQSSYYLYCVGSSIGANTYCWRSSQRFPYQWALSGTPLNDAIVISRDIIKKFKTDNNISKVNAIYLTDGASNSSDLIWDSTKDGNVRNAGIRYSAPWYHRENQDDYNNGYVVDPITKKEYGIDSQYDLTKALLKSVGDCYDVNVIGYYIVNNNSDFKYAIQTQIDTRGIDLKDATKVYRKDGYIMVEQFGYDQFFLIRGGKHLDLEGSEKFSPDGDMTKAKLTTAFKKHTKGKVTNRVILNKFIEAIA